MVQQHSFEVLIAIYLFLAGVGAGAILSAVALDMYDRKRFINYIKAASLLGMPLVSIGCGFLVLDLGQGLTKPWLLIFLFMNPTSVITWGTAILTVFIIFATVYAVYNFNILKLAAKLQCLLRPMQILLIIFAIGTAGYTAVLLGSLKAIPLWNQTALPVLFIVSALSTGVAATLIVSALFFKAEKDPLFGTLHIGLIALELLILAGFILIALNGVPELVYAVKLLVVGPYAKMFWGVLIVAGLIVPLIVTVMESRHTVHLGFLGILLAEGLTLLGGFYLRYLILHAGTFIDKFAGFIL